MPVRRRRLSARALGKIVVERHGLDAALQAYGLTHDPSPESTDLYWIGVSAVQWGDITLDGSLT